MEDLPVSAYMEYCITDRQKELLEAIMKTGSCRKAAAEVGVTHQFVSRTLAKIKARAHSKGVAPEKDLYYPLPDTQIITGVSTLQRSPGGNLQWVKTKAGAEAQLEMMRAAIQELVADVPRILPQAAEQKHYSEDLMAVYPLGDPHIGMMAWGEECGMDWDLKIAEAAFTDVFERLVRTAPSCETAVIVNLGDYFHSDNARAMTERSGHHLDVDGRQGKIIRVGMRILRRMIDSALSVHKRVRIINAIGNHDANGADWSNVALENLYENEPRIEIVSKSPSPFHYVRFGKVLIGAHHGHTCKAEHLPGVMASDKAKDWGETEFRYWLTGHIHHTSVKEYPGVTVESFRTLAAKDAYAAWGGYRSGQDSKCLVMHREFGEVERHTVNIKQSMFKDE